jgi:hypothetical protein
MESGVCMSQGPQFVTRRAYRRLLMVVSGSIVWPISAVFFCFRREARGIPIARVMTAAQAAETTFSLDSTRGIFKMECNIGA